MKTPVLLIQAGAGARYRSRERMELVHRSLERILKQSYRLLLDGASAKDTVVFANTLLEDDPLFNAGYGSKLQADGKARLSASLMDGETRRFSGVVNVEGLRNPVLLAARLNQDAYRSLAGKGAAAYARDLGLPFRSPVTAERRAEYRKELKGKTGTVGAVALDRKGRIAAATSTGGRGMERPGRVSDTPTVSGNYANRLCGISATGVGEEIIDFALCARIAVRVEDGLTLQESFRKSFREAKRRGYGFGAIGVARDGSFAAETTTGFMNWAVRYGAEIKINP